ncbi:MAG: fumarylacetoacetate hydrolase family protein, partial [Chloroflexi bacterium]|nr:fumarylacetoacetate hydrolase family protein [Chloroflexota bacterium]
VSESAALDYVAGYTCINDVSARDIQFADKQWTRGKSFDTFLPMGPCLTTRDEIPDPQSLSIRCVVSGETLQNSSTSNMIFTCAFLLAFISRSITLEPGDIVATGTPDGVGVFRKPQRFLKAGDHVTVSLERIGDLSNPVV